MPTVLVLYQQIKDDWQLRANLYLMMMIITIIRDRVYLYSLVCPKTHYVDQVGPELRRSTGIC